jgi:hypothetical protein
MSSEKSESSWDHSTYLQTRYKFLGCKDTAVDNFAILKLCAVWETENINYLI